MGINDGRQAPVCYQEIEAMRVLREGIPPSGAAVKRQVAVAVYQALTEVSVERRDRAEWEAARKETALLAGVAAKTVDRCAVEFERLGLLRIDRGTETLPSLWTLVAPVAGHTPPEEAAVEAEAREEEADRATTSSKEAKQREFLATLDDLLDSSLNLADLDSIEPNGDGEIVLDGLDLLRQGKKVDGKLITPREMGIAATALAAFNRCYEYKKPGGEKVVKGSDYGLGGNLTSIVMRIREHPSWDASKHVRLVESAWRIRWWERNPERRPGPNVIYGVNSFENVVQDAGEEAAGESPSKIRKRRYTRG